MRNPITTTCTDLFQNFAKCILYIHENIYSIHTTTKHFEEKLLAMTRHYNRLLLFAEITSDVTDSTVDDDKKVFRLSLFLAKIKQCQRHRLLPTSQEKCFLTWRLFEDRKRRQLIEHINISRSWMRRKHTTLEFKQCAKYAMFFSQTLSTRGDNNNNDYSCVCSSFKTPAASSRKKVMLRR